MEAPFPELLFEPSGVATDYSSMLPVEGRASSHSPLRPGSTLMPYQPNGANGPRTPGRLGKSQHLAQIRSLGLLHDLQEYISSVEHIAAEQRRELEKIKEEKRDMERFMARADLAAQERPPGPTLDFSVTEVSDLPPRLRALVEDNRGLRELVKRYKCRTTSLEHQVGQLQAQVLALADANDRLKQSLAECSRTPAEVDREETLRRQLEVKNRQVENLEHGMGVLRNKLETDLKLYRQNLSSAAREKDALKRQLVAANRVVEERDKELRAANVELRRARRGAPPTRGGPPFHPPTAASAAGADDDAGAEGAGPAATAAVAAAAAAAGAATAAAAPPPPPAAEPAERIRIMLMIVRDEIRVEVPVPVPMIMETPRTPLEGSPGGVSEAGDQMGGEESLPLAEAESAPAEAQPEPEPAAAPEPADDPSSAPVQAPEPVSEPEPAPEPEPAALEPLGEELSVMDARTTTDGGYEPSVVGLMEEGALASEASGAAAPEALAPVEEDDGGAALDVWGGVAADAAAAAAVAEVGDSAEAQAPPPERASVSVAVHTHSSAPLPIPYSRTAARALATKVGGVSSKLASAPSAPAPSGNGGSSSSSSSASAAAAGGPSRKHSTAGAAGAAPAGGSGLRSGASLKSVGGTSRR